MFEYAETARERGLKVIIAGAGGAAHLPGMVAAKTNLPVIGVPVQSKALNGLDSLLYPSSREGFQLQLLQLVRLVQQMLVYLLHKYLDHSMMTYMMH